MGKKWDVAIGGTVNLGSARPASVEPRPWTQADGDEENQVMREDG